ncbi:MAG: hypothetical protein GXY53_03250 [Desulfobulbus sp.]|nr:hypothetical protein [Desulfobulbus sp.]
MDATSAAVQAFIEDWAESPDGNKQGFIRLKDLLAGLEGIEVSFHPRPGVTYSLRGAAPESGRPLFVMIDVIEDEPRWLSVCFFGDMIQDPVQLGAEVPGGLLGEDALCFDLETCTEESVAYVAARIREAHRSAVGG